MAEAPFDLPKAQRWFAVDLNNVAWDLLDKQPRSDDETERMVHAAHASVHHWFGAGNEINHLRGMVLLANVYASAGRGEEAVRYAERGLALSDEAGDAQSAFDRATVLAAAARAQSVCGNVDAAREFLTLARQAADKLPPDDRAVFDQLCPKL